MNLLYLADATAAESYQAFAGLVYFASTLYVWILSFSIYKHHMRLNFQSKDKALFRMLGYVALYHVVLSIAAVFLFTGDIVTKEVMLLPLIHWIITIPALISLITFWQFRHGQLANLPGSFRENRNFGIALGIFSGVCILGLSFGLEIIWPGELKISDSQLELLSDKNALFIYLGIAMLAPFVEEIIFRLGVQTSLENFCRIIKVSPIHAIGFTSLIFALSHGGSVEPIGFKETQIFITGFILGSLKYKYGFYSCLAAHLTLNGLIVLNHLIFGL